MGRELLIVKITGFEIIGFEIYHVYILLFRYVWICVYVHVLTFFEGHYENIQGEVIELEEHKAENRTLKKPLFKEGVEEESLPNKLRERKKYNRKKFPWK